MREVTGLVKGSDGSFDGLFRELSPAAVGVYARITRDEPLSVEDKPALEELAGWGLVGFDPEVPDVPVALDPSEAVQRRTNAQLQQLAEQAARIRNGPQVAEELGAHFDRAKWESGHGSLFLAERELVNARIEAVFAGAQHEVLTAQPGGPRSQEHRDIAMERDSAALRRGVKIKTLYRDSVREDPLTREWAHAMTGLGAVYRTLADPFEKIIIVDRRTAFIRDHIGGDGAPEHAAWQVTDRPVVALIAAVFQETWRRATPWTGEAAVTGDAAGTRTTPIQRAILRDTADGIQQEITAKRLDISLRRLQRELAEVKDRWHAPTLAALTFQWATSPDRNIDDQIDTVSSAGGGEDLA